MRVPYGEDAAQFCELRFPRGKGPFPVAALFHGGFWRSKYDRKLMWGIGRSLRKRGWATWNVEYRRLEGTGGGWPMTFDDVAEAMDALHHRDERLDLARLVTIGHSAGGHLSLWAAARSRLPAGMPGADPLVSPARAVCLAGCADLRAVAALAGGRHSVVYDLVGGTPEEVPERYAAACPSQIGPTGLPTLLVHGDRDQTIPVSVSERYLEVAGEECGLAVIEGDAHRSPIFPWTASWRTVLGWL